MLGWHWFWTLVGFLVYLVVLIFLYFYQPFEDLFTLVINGLSYDNAIFWAVVIIAIIGFCGYHWRAYRLYIIEQNSVERMVLASLRGSTFVAVLLSAGAALQAVQILCVYLLRDDFGLDREFGLRLAAVVALVILTGIFCIIFWLLRIVRTAPARSG
ncbi:MAG: hypothetical protein MI806_13245 [Minwuiales bacterium]|nr:hypothetical protein [Minwuiales bacterium]